MAFAAALVLTVGAGQASAACNLGQMAQLPVTMEGLSPVVPAKINGADVRLIADSGAFFSMLSPPSAARLKLSTQPAPFQLRVMGVTGEVRVELAKAKDFTILNHDFQNADFLVGGPVMGGEVDGLLGANLLDFADVEYDLGNGVIRLFREHACLSSNLAYWAQTLPFSVVDIDASTPTSRRIRATASVNGAKIHVEFDSGASMSILTKSAARRAGVRTDGPDVIPSGPTGGLGRRFVNSWLAPVKSFKIGDEDVQNTRLRIGDIELDDADMLLGADFFLSHRIYVANGQRKLYFTYNGGPVFRLDRPAAQDAGSPSGSSPALPQPGAPTAATVPAPAQDQYSDAPADAAGFARRGKASAARGEYAKAIADLTRAIELDPKVPDHYFDRARVRVQAGQRALALADLDQTLKLKPDHLEALESRAAMRLSDKDEAGARADLEAVVAQKPMMRADIATLYTGAGMFADAVAQLDRWIADHPKDPGMAAALNNRCWARALWGRDLDQALADCNASLKSEGHDPSVLDSRGLVRLRLGQLDGSIADYDEALRRRPGTAWSLYGRGLAKLKKGMKAEGDADIRAAAQLAPKLPDEAKKYGLTP